MAATDRTAGAVSNVAFKAPCRVATTTNIILNGLQSIDGVTVVQDDRVLVVEQTDTTENGIWVADSGEWTRALDFNGANDCMQGTRVGVYAGTAYAGTTWQLDTAAPVIGTSALAFSALGASAGGTLPTISAFMEGVLDDTTAPAARTTLGAVGLTGDETVAGNKTFSGNNTYSGSDTHTGAKNFTGATVTVANASLDAHPVNKGQLDAAIAAITPGGGAPINQSTQGPTYQFLIASGTYSTPAGCVWIKVIRKGGGGSGGSNVDGGDGGDTTFNSVVAKGGKGGGAASQQAKGGLGGSAGTGTAFRRRGAPGGNGMADAVVWAIGGQGGGNGGAQGADGNGGVGISGSAAANNTGGGGGGGVANSFVGGAGGGGEGEEAEDIIHNPSATYIYTIGAGGTVSGGGSGGSGYVVVEQHFNY